MYGELALTTGQTGRQFADGVFNNGTDKPFEVHRMIPRVYARDSGNLLLNAQPDMELLLGLIRANITITNLEQKLTKAPTALGALVKGSAERSWEFADPFYLIKSNNMTVEADALTFPANTAISNLNNLLVTIAWEGFFVIVAPPGSHR